MAIDPATAKLIAQAAAKIVTDEETRKKAAAIALIPIITLVVIVGVPFYILTNPLESLSALFGVNQSHITAASDFQNSYGYFGDGSLIDISGEYADSQIPLFLQGDKRWGMFPYGKSGTIATSGCGPTSLAMVVVGLTDDTSVNPKAVADWSVQNGHRVEGVGSAWSLMTSGGAHFGLKVSALNVKASDISDALRDGKPVIMSMNKGHFTQSGHFIVLRGITESGKILVNDPASSKRSQQEWDISIIVNEGAGAWAFAK
jgi:hypothetical protein